jgi:hypothetical protein
MLLTVTDRSDRRQYFQTYYRDVRELEAIKTVANRWRFDACSDLHTIYPWPAAICPS